MYQSFLIGGSYYIVILITLVITIIAQVNVQGTFAKYSRVYAGRGLSGAEVASGILASQGISNVRVGHVQGSMTDHYDPGHKLVNLSDTVYGQTSISAVAVAAHECGHAVQDAYGYGPLTIRTAIVPMVNFSSQISWFLIVAGLFINSSTGSLLLRIGIVLFSAAVAFQLITLPVEFNASSRALKILAGNGMLSQEEMRGAKKVLRAAALTYVAAAATSVIQLIRLIFIARNRED